MSSWAFMEMNFHTTRSNHLVVDELESLILLEEVL
jgi:hypothetical protein